MKKLSSNISASAIAACVLASVWSLGVFAVDNSSSARENLASVENGNIAPAGVVCAAGGGIAGICTSQLDELKVLMIGNSSSRPVVRTLPALAKSAGVRLDIASLYIGGCSLERHARNIKNDAAEYLIERNNNGERLKREKARISEWLPKEKWDIVTIQQASPLSWRPETFEPWGDEVIAEIRRLAPQAEIVVQETWSYNAADGRLKKEGKGAWGFGQDEMYRRIHEAVGSFAKRRGLRVIPTGAAIQAVRAKGGEDVVGNGGDTIHLNEAGEKIQAEVWLKTLFGNLDVERRITELLSRMTLEEKIGQLSQTNGGNPSGAQSEDMSEAPLDPAFLAELAAGRYGSLLGKRGAKNYNILQEAAMSGRLGIPLLVGHDMIHSSRTCFPIPLALSCAFDDDLWERIGAAIAVESLTVGCNWTFTPMIDVARDARWGRIAESAGSDPLVTSRFGAAMVRGLQGDDLADGRHIAACAKHYVAYGAPLGGRDYNAVELSDATLRDIYLPPFRAAVAAGVATVMPAFHSFNDVPCSMNSYLLRDILRGEMGFRGMTISDWEAVGELVPHGVATPGADAAAKALNAGMDMEMVSTHYADGLAEAVASGIVREETLDAAVRNVLRLKFRMGLFDHPTIDAPALEKTIDFAAQWSNKLGDINHFFRGRADFVYAIAVDADDGRLPRPCPASSPYPEDAAGAAAPDGVVGRPGAVAVKKFTIEEPGPHVLEVTARRRGSPLDAVLTLRKEPGGIALAQWDDVTNTVFTGTIPQGECDPVGVYDFREPGDYIAEVTDRTGHSGEAYVWWLDVRRSEPDFEVRSLRSTLPLRGGAAQKVGFVVVRKGGFAGDVAIEFPENIRPRSAVVVTSGVDTVTAELFFKGKRREEIHPVNLFAHATIDGRLVRRQVVPCDEYEQAFAWRHLVPARSFLLSGIPEASGGKGKRQNDKKGKGKARKADKPPKAQRVN